MVEAESERVSPGDGSLKRRGRRLSVQRETEEE